MGGVSLWELALSFLLCVFESFAVFFLAASFAPMKRPKHIWLAAIVCSLAICLETNYLNRLGAVFTIIHIAYVLLVQSWLIKHLLYCQVLVTATIVMLADVYLAAIDGLFISLMLGLFGEEELSANQVITYSLSFLAKFVELGGVLLFFRWRSRRRPRRDPDITGWMLVELFSAPAYILSMWVARSEWFGPDIVWITCTVFGSLSFVCVGAFFLLDYSGRKQETDREKAALQQNLKLETAHIASMESRYTQQRAQTHDFKNQLAVLRDMAGRNAPQEEFAAYLNSMLEIDIPGVLYINTHRTVVDVIMSEKVPVAKDKGIDFQFQLDDLTDFPLPDDALVVVLTNLIDNAIEASEKIPQAAERHIWMRMKVDREIALLGIDNSTHEPVAIRDNAVQTTKDDPMAHGYGLKNVAAMIEKSGGMWFIEYDAAGKKFRFSASIPMETE